MAAYRILNEQGDVLGTLEVLRGAIPALEKDLSWVFHLYEPPSCAAFNYQNDISPIGSFVRRAALCPHHTHNGTRGFVLHGVTIEDLENTPDFMFTPSVSYVRKLIEEARNSGN